MRSLAKISEAAVVVDGHAFVGDTLVSCVDTLVRNPINEFEFERLVTFGEPGARLVVIPVFLQERHVGFNHRLHVPFDFGEIVGCNRARHLHIVIELVLDRRADGEFHAGFTIRKKLLHGIRHNMRSGVTQPL